MDVDLHIHSTASDGSMAPNDIVACARQLKLKAIAITDHDTTIGSRSILSSALPEDIHVLSGVEISSIPPKPFDCKGSFHILGYGINPDDPALETALDRVRKARNDRNDKMISRLAQHGIDITFEDVAREAGGHVIGRPHIAKAMIGKGYARSVNDAFERYLAPGRPAYVEKYKMDCEEALHTIRQAGGIPVLAHPVSLKIDFDTLESLLKEMISMGLMGLEAYYSTHDEDQTRAYCSLAGRLGLVITGGSDFHGTFKNDINMGSGKGSLNIPFDVYQNVLETIKSTRPVHLSEKQ